MKINKINQISYELDKDLRDYTIDEISDYCNTQCRCDDCVFKFLCKLDSGVERDMVDPAPWKDNAVRFQKSLEFQAVLEKNYEEGR